MVSCWYVIRWRSIGYNFSWYFWCWDWNGVYYVMLGYVFYFFSIWIIRWYESGNKVWDRNRLFFYFIRLSKIFFVISYSIGSFVEVCCFFFGSFILYNRRFDSCWLLCSERNYCFGKFLGCKLWFGLFLLIGDFWFLLFFWWGGIVFVRLIGFFFYFFYWWKMLFWCYFC